MKKRLALATIALMPATTVLANDSIGEITASSLNVRSGPSTDNNVLFTVKKGAKVEILESVSGWYKIKTNDNKIGFASSKYIKVTTDKLEENVKSKFVSIDGLNMRSGASMSYRVIKVLPKNIEAQIISEDKGWSKVKVDGRIGYVATKYLSDKAISNNNQNNSNNENNSNNQSNNLNIEKKVNASNLNVRSGAGTNFSVIGKLKRDTKVVVMSESNGWSKITYNNQNAYVSSKYLKDIETIKPPVSTKPEITPPPVVGGVTNELTVNHKKLDYTLKDHIKLQMDRVSVGGNVIHASRPRSIENSVEALNTTNSTISSMTRRAGFVNASEQDLNYFLNPDNFINSNKGMMQFLRIDNYKDGITENELNSYLNKLPNGSDNVFYNTAKYFINASKKYDIDLVYLVSHAMWETGFGASTLSKGQTIESYKGQKLEKPVTVYNFYGIGAIDKSANVSGAEAAYSNGWTSIEKTIDGSAKWIASNYIKSSKYKQNTIYKMKFNYDYSWHQYATDVNWANGISKIMIELISMYENSNDLSFEIPNYK